jgi:hypothetical protein
MMFMGLHGSKIGDTNCPTSRARVLSEVTNG